MTNEQKAEQPVPFGYVSEHTCEGLFQLQFHKNLDGIYWDTCKSVTTVYTAPQAKAEPLTDEQIDALWRKWTSAEGFTTAEFVRGFAREVAATTKEASK